MRKRCPWSEISKEMREYHDTEWGRPLFDDKKVLQAFFLDTFQAGLSWGQKQTALLLAGNLP